MATCMLIAWLREVFFCPLHLDSLGTMHLASLLARRQIDLSPLLPFAQAASWAADTPSSPRSHRL